MQYSDWSHSDSLFCPLLALQPQQQRAILSLLMIDASLIMCSQLAAFFRLMLSEVNSDPQYTHTVSRSRTSTSSSAGIFQLFAIIILCNVKRMHPYQRGRASITGLVFELRKIIETGRLVGVVMTRLVCAQHGHSPNGVQVPCMKTRNHENE